MTKRIFIGVAWPYVNGDLHIGHVAGYLLPADILARYSRLKGYKVLMVSGSDCFGTPISFEAEKLGVTPQLIVKKYHPRNKKIFKNLGISFDIYFKTYHPFHQKIVQKFILAFYQQGLLFIQKHLQYFDPQTNRFLPDRYVEGICPYCQFQGARGDQCENCGSLIDQNLLNPVNRLTKQPVILKETESLYIDWSKIQKNIERYVKSRGYKWRKWIFQETMTWLKNGLTPRAVSRDLNWGVKFPPEIIRQWPNLKNKRIYVWFDAVIGYFSASLYWSFKNKQKWQDFWYQQSYHYYFMGKDNLIFHTIFWPGQLMIFDSRLHLPDFPLINHYLNLEGQKFSKSRGIIIEINDFVKNFGADSLRFYMWKIMPQNKDTSFSWNDYFQTHNDILVGKVGNFIHRLLVLYYRQKISRPKKNILKKSLSYLNKFGNLIEKGDFVKAYDQFLKFTLWANQFIDQQKPWNFKNNFQKFSQLGGDLLTLAVSLLISLYPICPFSVEKYFRMLNIKKVFWPKNEIEFYKLIEQIKLNHRAKIVFAKLNPQNNQL